MEGAGTEHSRMKSLKLGICNFNFKDIFAKFVQNYFFMSGNRHYNIRQKLRSSWRLERGKP